MGLEVPNEQIGGSERNVCEVAAEPRNVNAEIWSTPKNTYI